MTVFFGNVIDMLISGSHIVAEPAYEFFLYALLTTTVIGLFVVLAMRYEYNDYTADKDAQMDFVQKLPQTQFNEMGNDFINCNSQL